MAESTYACACPATFSQSSCGRAGKGSEPADAEVEELLRELRDAEKVRVLSGTGNWQAGGVQRVGLPPLVMTDGPHGPRGFGNVGRDNSVLAPCETALAATFNEALIEEVGALLGRECARLGAHVLLGPAVNLHRVPTSGRHFECFSEDPHLSARAAVAYIRGVQRHVSACVKHFAANDKENNRFTTSSKVDERTLREAHLLPFEAAVREAGVETLMTAYNRLNGTHCAESKWLLDQVLRREWGFRGICISDWFGNVSTVRAIEAGLNVEMPGIEPRHYGGWLLDAVRAGQVSRRLLDERCRPVLRLLRRRGPAEPQAAATPEESTARRELLRRAAAESLVLLKNDDRVLPLDHKKLASIAVIGPNALETAVQGGGSCRVRPPPCQRILQALAEALLPHGVQFSHEHGTTSENLPHMFTEPVLKLVGVTGGCDAAGHPSSLDSARKIDRIFDWAGWFSRQEWFRRTVMRVLRWRGVGQAPPPGPRPPLAPPRPWRWRAAVAALLAMLLLWVRRRQWSRRRWRLTGLGLLALLGVRWTWPKVALRIGWGAEARRRREEEEKVKLAIFQEVLMQRAEAAAANADACVVVLGTHGFWETEGSDQPHMRLPGRQDELLVRVRLHARGPVVVVLNVGSPKELPWLDLVPAVLLTHFGGEQMAPAVVDALLGRVNPAGRLTTTWPREEKHVPGFVAWFAGGCPKEDGEEVTYREGLRSSYRAFCEGGLVPFPPLFAFGHGLSYARFDYGHLAVELLKTCSEEGGPRAAAYITVRNVGDRPGAEVAQLYTAAGTDGLRFLCGFGRSPVLAPGESVRFSFELDARALGRTYDVQAGAWRAPQPSAFVRVDVGASSADKRASAILMLR